MLTTGLALFNLLEVVTKDMASLGHVTQMMTNDDTWHYR